MAHTLVRGGVGVDASQPGVVACENGRVPTLPEPPENVLDHVVVVGGTPAQWLSMSVDDWLVRLSSVAKGAAVEGAHWVTVLPHHGEEMTSSEVSTFFETLSALPQVSIVEAPHGKRCVWQGVSGPKVVVDPIPDGHVRFAATVESLRLKGLDPEALDENTLSEAILFPADKEPDLVVVLGPANQIPQSMVWELAYSELVFIDLSWSLFDASHLELAIDDFNRRHRRFGGLDS